MRVIYETGVLKRRDGRGDPTLVDYVMTKLDRSHLSEIMALQETIVQNLAHADMLATFTEDFMAAHLGAQGFIIGVLVANRLVAFRNVFYPDRNDTIWNFGFDLGLNAGERNRMANLQMVCVHPVFRGNALAFKMNRVALTLLRQRGSHHHVCATVSPHNIWNVRILLDSGFRIRALKPKYGGKLRYLVHQSLREAASYGDGDPVRIPANDLFRIERILKAGYFGVAVALAGDGGATGSLEGIDILFQRPMAIGDPALPETCFASGRADRWNHRRQVEMYS